MNKPHYSPEYIAHRSRGPFPGRIDPWSEAAHYFHQIHPEIISQFIAQVKTPLEEMGYLIGRETSLQVMEGRQPDVFVQRSEFLREQIDLWDYGTAAIEVLAEPGVIAETRTLDAIHITESDTDALVTIVEVVSPSNKTEADSVAQYQDRRSRLVIHQGVNVVEVDLTRSVKRLFNHQLTTAYPYHVSVYLPGRWPYVIGTHINEPLKRIALPLRGEVVPVELQAAYNHAYQQVSIGGHILRDKKYNLKNLPFPSLLTADERNNALQAIEIWKAELERLRS